MAERAVTSLVMIVGLLALAAILILFALQLAGIVDIAQVDVVAGDFKFPDIVSTEFVGSFSLSDVTGDRKDTTSTEIACVIAKSLRKDFLEYGFGTTRPESSGNYRKLEIEKHRTIVDKGVFRIKWNPETGDFWKFEDLSDTVQDNMMLECSDTVQDWKCSTPYLDEECVTNAMGHLMVGDDFFCTKRPGKESKIKAGAALVDFGNNDCDRVADGEDNCKAHCPGGDRISAWRAPGGTGITEYIDEANWDWRSTIDDVGIDITDIVIDPFGNKTDLVIPKSFESYEWPPYQCKDDQCEPLYSWLLIYNKKKKKYEIEIARMAENIDLGNMSTTDLVDRLLQGEPFTHRFRDIESSYPYPELRTRYDITFQPTNEITLAGFLENFEDDLRGKDWNVEINQCFGDACYDTQPEKVKWKAVKSKVTTWPLAPWTYDQAVDNTKKRKQLRKINVQTNIENANELLKTNHTYRVVMRWWRTTYSTGYRGPGCGTPVVGGGVNCVACLEDNGNSINTRWEYHCEGEDDDMGGYESVNDKTRYFDQSLIVIDLGEEGSWGENVE